VLQLISIEKDVDGFSPINIGRLAQKGREPLFVPCTPYGCIYLLEQAGVKIEGANAVVLGRSNIVGMPAALLLIGKNATTTVCHSRTRDLPSVVRQADILIAAIGKMEMVRGDWIKPGAAIIDVGINSKPDATKKSGYRLVGDVCFDEAKEVAGFITPVPGGVGPMTIAMLMKNTLRAAQIQQGD
jgi:5,10-methylene-tetrahydrofolate dehydrogenase/methenyl tetrahydrofolate cyclohydrolase